MPLDPTILEYALIVTTASSCDRPSSALRVKFSVDGDMYSVTIPMTVADFARMVDDGEDIVSFIKSQEVFQD
ncbi:hypothetical protein COOONC_21329 [Cooperia oncophora]